MSFATAEEAVSARITAIATANGAGQQRDNAPEATALGVAAGWWRLRISKLGELPFSFGGTGNNKYAVQGQAMIEMHSTGKQGAAALRTLGTALEASMATGIRMASPDIRFESLTLGQFQDAGGWTRRDATIRFTYYEVR